MVRLLKRETGNTFLCAPFPPPGAWMVPLTPHPHPDSTFLTDIPDPGARANPVNRDTSRITMLEVDFFPLYLGEKIKKRVSPSFPFHPPPSPVCSALSQAAQPGAKAVTAPSHRGRGWLHCAEHPQSELTTALLSPARTKALHLALLLKLPGASTAAKKHP